MHLQATIWLEYAMQFPACGFSRPTLILVHQPV
jgi:hypothetical protein